MEHLQKDQIAKYCANQISEDDRSMIDLHLIECESCFSLYLDIIDNLPVEHSVSESFTDKTIYEIEKSPLFDQEKQKIKKKPHIMAHYFLAAGLTLILTFSGLFEEVMHITDETTPKQRVSVSEQIMNKTTDLLNQMKEDNNK